MISGLPGSMHPGDILTASNGVTIEVDNTDAEGRLTLADALVYAQKNVLTYSTLFQKIILCISFTVDVKPTSSEE